MRRRERVTAVAGFLGFLALRTALMRSHPGPLIVDEAGYLGNARWLAGDHHTWLVHGAPYYRWGYSVLLIPLVRLIRDPATLYVAVIWLNRLLVASVFPLLFLWLRRVHRIAPESALVGAVVATAYPALGASTGLALAENLLFPLYLLSLWALWWFLTRQGWQAWLFGPAVAALVATHPRFAPIAVLAAVSVAVIAWREPGRRWAGVGNFAVIVASLPMIQLMDQALLRARWIDVQRPEAGQGGVLGLLTDPSRWGTLAERAIGQAWYLVVGSVGLVLVGVVAAVALARRPATVTHAERTVTVYGLAVAALLFASTAAYFTLITTRIDQKLYGRYTEVALPPLLGLGAAWLVRAHHRRAAGLLAAAAAGGVVLFGLLVLPHGFAPFEHGAYAVNHVSAIAAWGQGKGPALMAGTLGAALLMLWLAAAVMARRAVLGLAAVAMLFAASAVLVDTRLSTGQRFLNSRRDLPRGAARVGAIDRAAYPVAEAGRSDAAVMQFWLNRTDFSDWPAGRAPLSRWVVAPKASTKPAKAGGRRVLIDARTHHALWVLPGPELDRFNRLGRLLPDDLRARLPARAGRATIRVKERRDRTFSISRSRRASATVHLRVTHRGRGSPWVDFASSPRRGSVRIGVRWRAAGDGRVLSQPFLRGDLPHTLWPGEAADVQFKLKAVGHGGRVMPAGRYVAELGVMQESIGFFGPPSATVSVPVQVG